MTGCSYCDKPGHGIDTCPKRLESRFGTSSRKYDGEGEVRADGGTQETSVTEMVLEQIHERTEADPDGEPIRSAVWTSKGWLKQDAAGSTVDFDPDDLDAEISRLAENGELVVWNGQLAPATDEHLRAIIANEKQSETPRKILIGKCNRLLQSKSGATDPEVVTDGGVPCGDGTDQFHVPTRLMYQPRIPSATHFFGLSRIHWRDSCETCIPPATPITSKPTAVIGNSVWTAQTAPTIHARPTTPLTPARQSILSRLYCWKILFSPESRSSEAGTDQEGSR